MLMSILKVINLDDDISEIAIEIRRKYYLKTPDSIIAATAIHQNFPLLTADTDFAKIEELEWIEYS